MGKRILVVGDSMLDMRVNCEVTRISPEAPIPIYDVDSEQVYSGGAANVALNVKAMGGDVTLLLPVGDDGAGNSLEDSLLASDLRYEPVYVNGTTTKTRLFTDRVARVRIDEDYILEENERRRVLERFYDMITDYDVIIFSDYGKGALGLVDEMIELSLDKITIVDPKGTDWQRYAGASYIKANTPEVLAMHSSPLHLAQTLGLWALIQTGGAAGSTVTYCNYREPPLHIPPLAVACVDPTGAGDSYLAALAVARSADDDLRTACLRASVAGALATTHIGTAVITKQEIDECLPGLLNTIPAP